MRRGTAGSFRRGVADGLSGWGSALLLAIPAAAALMVPAALGTTLTSFSPVWSYLVEPFSLVLIPAEYLVTEWEVGQPLSLYVMVAMSFALYTLLFAWVLRAWLKPPRRERSGVD